MQICKSCKPRKKPDRFSMALPTNLVGPSKNGWKFLAINANHFWSQPQTVKSTQTRLSRSPDSKKRVLSLLAHLSNNFARCSAIIVFSRFSVSFFCWGFVKKLELKLLKQAFQAQVFFFLSQNQLNRNEEATATDLETKKLVSSLKLLLEEEVAKRQQLEKDISVLRSKLDTVSGGKNIIDDSSSILAVETKEGMNKAKVVEVEAPTLAATPSSSGATQEDRIVAVKRIRSGDPIPPSPPLTSQSVVIGMYWREHAMSGWWPMEHPDTMMAMHQNVGCRASCHFINPDTSGQSGKSMREANSVLFHGP